MKVGVIGSSGAMGSFFVRYFLRRGFEVVGYDARPKKIRLLKLMDSRVRVARSSDVVIVATPMGKTVKTIRGFASALRPATVVVEISSVKGGLARDVRKALAARRARLLSIHPLFGPSLPMSERLKVCVMKDERGSVSLARRIFPGARLIPLTTEEHDKLMATVLSLTHAVNVAFASAVSRHGEFGMISKVSTPASSLQFDLAQSVLSQDGNLYSRIATSNKHSKAALNSFIRELQELRDAIADHDVGAYEQKFRQAARRFPLASRKGALKRVYRAYRSS